MNTYLQAFKNYANFAGRATRREYWVFYIFNLAFAVVAMLLDNLFGIALESVGYGPIYLLYALGLLIPGLSLTVRRLHDVGKSGWMILVALIPIAGPIWLIVLLASQGYPSENEYGSVPEEIQSVPASEEMIFLSILWAFFSTLVWAIMPRIDEAYYYTPLFDVVQKFMPVTGCAISLGTAISVRNKTLRVLLIIMAALILLNYLFTLVERAQEGDFQF